ncbi:MAG: RNA methyltransferase [Myxococcota bacterium]|nr:RNA methyltransferase [Myxococcota bacterium]
MSTDGVDERHQLFAIVVPGLEGVAAEELAELGLDEPTVVPGGVTVRGSLSQLFLANLRLRIASRLLLRVGEVRARAFSELSRRVATLPWERYLPPGQPLPPVRASSHASRLYHTTAIAEAVYEGLSRRLGGGEPGPAGDREDQDGALLVRLQCDRCTLSLDSSGELLHRRGYRQEVRRAPLRETLAAGVLRLARWDPTAPLVDPCCGTGTILLEGFGLAVGAAAGADRRFAMERWPAVADLDLPAQRCAVGTSRRPAPPGPLVGGDVQPGALAAARGNAARAGALAHLQLFTCDFEELPLPSPPGWLISNLPYGERLGDRRSIVTLYRRLGQHLRRVARGWRIALLVGARSPADALGWRWDTVTRLANGGLPVRLLQGRC